jgi:ABC-type multidrug transport system fused ATPase/permease subunit
MKPYHLEMTLSIIVAFLKHGAAISAAGITAYITALAMKNSLLERFNVLFLMLLTAIIVRVLMYYAEMWLGHDVAFKVLKDFRVKLYDKIEETAPAYLLEKHSGQIGSALMADVEILEWFLAHTFGAAIASFFISILILASLSFIHPVIALIMLPFAVLIASTPFIFRHKADMQGRDVREKLAQANAVTIEGIHGLRDLLTLNALETYKERNRNVMRRLYDAHLTYNKRLGTETMLMNLLTGIFTVIIMAAAAYFVSLNNMDTIWYPVIVLLSAMLFGPITEVCGAARNLGMMFAAADRIQTVFDVTPAVNDGVDTKLPSIIRENISFNNVFFRYNANRENVLNNVSWTAEAGKVTALAGHSGAGKSTCVNLLLRYWDTRSGSISIDGVDIRNMSLGTLHTISCAVLQDVYLFNISVRENIRLGNPGASDDEVLDAAKKAYADEFIEQLPDGYDTITGERGFRLSGGQRQRIAIARAILKNAPLLILDEAVSSLDAESEFYIRKAFKEQLAGRTIILIAHRLSTIMQADKLVILQNGQVVQTGTHSQLIAEEGYYKQLIAAQEM